MLKQLRIRSSCLSAAVKRGNNRGDVVIEFAIVFVLLLLILFGVIEFGWAFFTKAVVTNTAREGARLAVTPSASDATIVARVNSYLDNFLLTSSRTVEIIPSVSPGPPSSPPSGTNVTVRVTYNYTPLTSTFIRSTPWTIVAQSSMRRE